MKVTSDDLKEIEAYEYTNPSKRRAQKKFLSSDFRNSIRKFKRIDALVLAGKRGWDIDYLLSIRVKGKQYPTHIVAVERDLKSYTSLCDRYKNEITKGTVEIHHSSLFDYLITTDRKFNFVYLDYFSNFGFLLRTDIEAIISRGLLDSGAIFSFTFFGSRESQQNVFINDTDFIRSRSLDTYETKESKDHTLSDDMDTKRVQWVKSFFIQMMCKYRLSFRKPRASKYKSGKSSMINFRINYLGENKIRKVNGATSSKGNIAKLKQQIHNSRKLWFGHIEPENITADSRSPLKVRSDNNYNTVKEAEDFLGYTKKQIKTHLNKYRVVPTAKEVNFTSGSYYKVKYTDIIRSVGLCPNTNSTFDDVKNAIKYISDVDGVVTKEVLKKTKLFRKAEEHLAKLGESTLSELLEELDVVYISGKSMRTDKLTTKTRLIYEEFILSEYIASRKSDKEFKSCKMDIMNKLIREVRYIKDSRSRLSKAIFLLDDIKNRNRKIFTEEQLSIVIGNFSKTMKELV